MLQPHPEQEADLGARLVTLLFGGMWMFFKNTIWDQSWGTRWHLTEEQPMGPLAPHGTSLHLLSVSEGSRHSTDKGSAEWVEHLPTLTCQILTKI